MKEFNFPEYRDISWAVIESAMDRAGTLRCNTLREAKNTLPAHLRTQLARQQCQWFYRGVAFGMLLNALSKGVCFGGIVTGNKLREQSGPDSSPDSVTEFCPWIQRYVNLSQTHADCMRVHSCRGKHIDCPLEAQFLAAA